MRDPSLPPPPSKEEEDAAAGSRKAVRAPERSANWSGKGASVRGVVEDA